LVAFVLLNLDGMLLACDDLVRTVIQSQIHESERVFLEVQICRCKLGVRSRATPDVNCDLLCLNLFKISWSDCDSLSCNTSCKLSLKTWTQLFLNDVFKLVQLELDMGKRHI